MCVEERGGRCKRVERDFGVGVTEPPRCCYYLTCWGAPEGASCGGSACNPLVPLEKRQTKKQHVKNISIGPPERAYGSAQWYY